MEGKFGKAKKAGIWTRVQAGAVSWLWARTVNGHIYRHKKSPRFPGGHYVDLFSYTLIRVHYLRRWILAPIFRPIAPLFVICRTYCFECFDMAVQVRSVWDMLEVAVGVSRQRVCHHLAPCRG